MIPSILLPRWFKWIGFVLALSGYVAGADYPWDPDDVMHPQGLLIQVAILIGLLFIADSREKIEDERIRFIRLTSLQWSVAVLILLRLSLKIAAFSSRDRDWLPHIETNVLLLIYLLLFYGQVYVPGMVARLFKGNGE